MENPQDLKYTKDHEWIRVEGTRAIIGVTDVAQSLMGDVVFVELPEIGAEYAPGEAAANIESVKAVSEVFAPVGGKVLEVNTVLEDTPELINKDAFGEAWIMVLEISDTGELDNLLSAEEYGKLLVEGE
ncbi:glycine cleavage system protein GcvH [Phosphitispora fastidiosa]|uniref:glycine cleavage system protein GcvH n=1 Tax=Phosphitispora fastidiosa TaxID=2837202 RepID=UPI001E4624BB|nr:glycine cleavage system protein GcvH [Phosphitispora fastidiosa]MBU7005744.1 glycine cleavage system H protein [Phosphitispora fastidiosa]